MPEAPLDLAFNGLGIAHMQTKIHIKASLEDTAETSVGSLKKPFFIFLSPSIYVLRLRFFIFFLFFGAEPKEPAAAAASFQSCPTLRDPVDGSPPGSPVPGILQARTLEWVAIYFSNA